MSQNFFIGSIGSRVLRIAPNGFAQAILVKSYDMAQYLHDTQKWGYQYKEIAVSDNTCVACEGWTVYK